MFSDELCIMNEAVIMIAVAPPGRGAARLVAPLHPIQLIRTGQTSNNNRSKQIGQRMGRAWTQRGTSM